MSRVTIFCTDHTEHEIECDDFFDDGMTLKLFRGMLAFSIWTKNNILHYEVKYE